MNLRIASTCTNSAVSLSRPARQRATEDERFITPLEQPGNPRRIAAFFFVALSAMMTLNAQTSQSAVPLPMGTWTGHPEGLNDYPVRLMVQSNGTCQYDELRNPKNRFVGTCAWNQWNQSDPHDLELTYCFAFTGCSYRHFGVTWQTSTSFLMKFEGDFDPLKAGGPHDSAVMRQTSRKTQNIDPTPEWTIFVWSIISAGAVLGLIGLAAVGVFVKFIMDVVRVRKPAE